MYRSKLGKAVEEQGGTVIHVDDPADLVNLNLNFVENRYKGIRR